MGVRPEGPGAEILSCSGDVLKAEPAGFAGRLAVWKAERGLQSPLRGRLRKLGPAEATMVTSRF